MAIVLHAADAVGKGGYEWDFSDESQISAFNIAFAEISDQKDGVVYMTSLSAGSRHDPNVFTPNMEIDASEIQKIVVGFSFEAPVSGNLGSFMFFRTADTNFNGDWCVRIDRPEGYSSDGRIVEYVFDMSTNPAWKGTITQLRFDPFEGKGDNLGGTFGLDYIKLLDAEASACYIPKQSDPAVPEGITDGVIEGSSWILDFTKLPDGAQIPFAPANLASCQVENGMLKMTVTEKDPHIIYTGRLSR